MSTNNIVFLEVIEWFDETGQELVHRIPETGSGEIKFGAQLTVRESQAAVFFYNGRAVDAFGAGRHTLTTGNIPILTKLVSIPWGMHSPLRAEVYFVNLKEFVNLKWGTRDPVAFKDTEFGLVRLRAFGVFSIQVVQPVLFINKLVGTQGIYTREEMDAYLSQVIVSRFNDFLGTHLDTILNLPGKYESIAKTLVNMVQDDFSRYGIGLSAFYVNAITPPQDVQKAIDDKSRLSLFDDMNRLLQMKAAMAVEKASVSQGAAASGMGLGLGLMVPPMFANTFTSPQPGQAPGEHQPTCPVCTQVIGKESKFCPRCGHQMLVLGQCSGCGINLPPAARFCPQCGKEIVQKRESKPCVHCGTENLNESIYCNHCGEKLDR
jgi:membrane protease subunit (stomatin/prohibitin family)